MMVTFVSQCEHKSLNRTRRVLDAFANRIGSRTWQTVITEEGLQAVKKLLCHTATKNTAVSCHWIRSRSRSEFLWVVGSKDEFNAQGIVPVNYTNQIDALKMDKIDVNIENYYANTKKQPLDQHLFAVGYAAYQIIQKLELDDEGNKLAQAVFVAGCLHDVGKIDPAFQQWIADELKKKKQSDIPDEGQHIEKTTGKFSFETHPRHNEISLLIYHLLNDESYNKINKRNKDCIKHTLYWHHAKPIRKIDLKNIEDIYKKLKNNLGDSDFSTIFQAVKQIVKCINALSNEYFEENDLLIEGFLKKIDDDRVYDLSNSPLPSYKRYSSSNDNIKDYFDNIKENARNNIARTAVITADRLISALSHEELTKYIEEKTLDNLIENAFTKERGLNLAIQDCLDGFEKKYPNSERNQQQAIAATALAEEEVNVGVLNGAAGCGKTKIALEWAAKTSVKKIIWVCPRVQVCQGLFHDLTTLDYLPNAKIEINTGEFKQIHQSGKIIETPEGQEFSGDIVITTIDQITNAIITHRKVTSLVAYMNAHIIFDEYHEYINMPAFNLLFAELVECKKLQNNAKALLVSATPNYYFVEELLGLNQQDIIGIESFNKSLYQIKFTSFDEAKQDETNPLYQLQSENTFVISNTAITAQQSFITNQSDEKAILFHGKFKKSDKQDLFNKVFECFKESGNHQYALLRSGPIIQASLNISCDKMVTEFTHAENWLQRLGRLDRFGKNTELNLYITAIPETLADGKQTGKCARFLNSLHSLQSAKAWYAFLQDELTNDSVTINQLYQLYQRFYENNTHRAAIEEDLKKALKKSVEVINNEVLDPVSLSNKKQPKDGKAKIKKQSLRGNNRFVQMAVWNMRNGKEEFPNEYAYSETDLDEANKANLTYSVEAILGYSDNEKDLLDFMVKKHHSVKDTEKYGVTSTTKYKNKIYLNKSRELETPIYLSYTSTDLEKVGSVPPHSYAVYYAIGINQPIGAIARNRLELEE